MQRQKLRLFLVDFDECLTHFSTDKNPKAIGRTVYEAGLSRCKTPEQRNAYLAQNMKPRVAELFRRIIQTDSCVAGIVTFSNDPETVKAHLIAAGLTDEEVSAIKFRFRPANFHPDTSKKDTMVLNIVDEIGRDNIECVYYADDTARHVDDVTACMAANHIPCQALLVPRGFKNHKANKPEDSFIDQFIEIAGKHIKHLPKDVINYMLRFATPASVLALSDTCRFFNGAIKPEIKEAAKCALRKDIAMIMRRFNPENFKHHIGLFQCVLLGHVNTDKMDIIARYLPPSLTLATVPEFGTRIFREGNTHLSVMLWNSIQFINLKNAHIAVACATTHINDVPPDGEIDLVMPSLRILLTRIRECNPNAVKVVLINTAWKRALTTEQMSNISNRLQDEFGSDLICRQVNSEKGTGIEEALNSAVATTLIRHYQNQQSQKSSKCTLM
jgi:hypothetical protein